ncbi:MAG: hypothetical protein J3K34DRAFT_489325 [Monoraphidium minutum]|nr:MAG: hypothetical protein J3K34DRAFT_489325 [Monoraphidium minutum]
MAMALLSRRAGAMPQSLGWRRALRATPARGVVAPIRARPQARSQSGGSRSSGAPWLDRMFGSKISSGGGGGGGGRSDIMAFVQLLVVAATLLTSTTQLRTELGAKIDAQSAKIDALTRAISDAAESVGALKGASDILIQLERDHLAKASSPVKDHTSSG